MTGDSEGPISLDYPIRSNRLQDLGNSCAAEWNVRWGPASYYMLGSRVLRPLCCMLSWIFSAEFMFTATYNPNHMLHHGAPLQYLAGQIYIFLQGLNFSQFRWNCELLVARLFEIVFMRPVWTSFSAQSTISLLLVHKWVQMFLSGLNVEQIEFAVCPAARQVLACVFVGRGVKWRCPDLVEPPPGHSSGGHKKLQVSK